MSEGIVTATLPTLDHVGFVGEDMARLRAAMQRLGFAPTEPRLLMSGRPGTPELRTLQQQSCHIVLQHDYIELSAVLTADPTHHLAAYRVRGEGLHILALGVADVDAQARVCGAAGLAVTPVAEATRRIDYGTQHGDARFRWFMFSPDTVPEGLLCYVRNQTPELVFQPEVSAHPNAAVAVAEICVTVSDADLAAATERYRSLLGASVAGADFALGQGGHVMLVTRDALVARFGAAAEDSPTGRFSALVVRSASLAQTRASLASAAIDFAARDGLLVVPPKAACGALLAFVGGG